MLSKPRRYAASSLLAIGSIVGCGGGTRNSPSEDAGASTDVNDVGASADVEDSSTGLDSAQSCQDDSDCMQLAERFCLECYVGGTICAAARCINARCQSIPAWCDGPLTAPCERKHCGDDCEQCWTVDGGCYQGTCNWQGSCKPVAVDCSVDAGSICAPQDAVAVGDCNALLGFAWDGSKCNSLVGCTCKGSDCLFRRKSEFECFADHQSCIAATLR